MRGKNHTYMWLWGWVFAVQLGKVVSESVRISPLRSVNSPSHRQVTGWIYSTRHEFPFTEWVWSPIRWLLDAPECECHYCILGHLLPCWSLWFVGAEVGRTVDCFLPWQLTQHPLILWDLVLKERVSRLVPTRMLQVLRWEFVESSVTGSEHQDLGSNQRQQQKLILFWESLWSSWSTTWRGVSHVWY